MGSQNVECQTDADCPSDYICPTTPTEAAHHEDILGFYDRYCTKGIRTDLFEAVGDCSVSGGEGKCYADANCVSSSFFGLANYRPNEFCMVTILKPVDVIPSETWEMECVDGNYDGLYIDGGWMCDKQYVPPILNPGTKVEWYTDTYYEMSGWQLCLTERTNLQVQESDWVQVIGDCELRNNCVSSLNYPEQYGENAYCTVEAKTNLVLTPSAGFDIEADYSDHLVVGWGDPIYDEADVPVRLTKGYFIVWDTDYAVNHNGWEICFEETTIPDGWICLAAYYGTGDGCDCACGVIDPDCESSYTDIWNCPDEHHTCDVDTALCVDPDGYEAASWNWNCNTDWFNADDGCDCECGNVDPDCLGDYDQLYNCNPGETCSTLHGNCLAAEEMMMDDPPEDDSMDCSGNGSWQTGEFGECSHSCGGGYQFRDVTCSTGMVQDCTDAKPTEYQACNTDECLGPCAEFMDDPEGLAGFLTGMGYPAYECGQVVDHCDVSQIEMYCQETCCLDE
eukprot:TRINITY_DN36_c0_g1_i3.p1 TRINITY_DN36_c0_g1~~TRINITY_DN36_c0_g1_i3.p1  ORF type:complete len:520 (+),score=118.50 TRINITY_DN36_c0_g1_i3:41-1561(+)